MPIGNVIAPKTFERPGNALTTVRRVLIVKSALEPYVLAFYSGLEKRLAKENIQLRVLVPANCCGTYAADWLVRVEGGHFNILGRTLNWQRIGKYVKGAQLIIMQQNARELTNYWLLYFRKTYGYKLAFWGHGTEFQRSFTTPLARLVKLRMLGKVDFFFAYTPGVAKIVESQGYARERTRAVFNSVDTAVEVALHRSVTEESKLVLRTKLGLRAGAKLVTYCGALYKAKRLHFLIEACKAVRDTGIDLHLAVVGDGDERPFLDSLSQKEEWIHIAGSLYGEEKAVYLAASECMTIPGVIGLVVVDAFAHECPLVTTCVQGHGPEIEYLVDGVNGIMAADRIDSYIHSLIDVLTDEGLQSRLRRGCREAASKITMDNMVEEFAKGVLAAIGLPALA